MLSVVKPETVTAGEAMKTNSILADLLMEQRLERMDRVNERQEKMLAKIKQEKKEKERDEFIKSQYALMKRKGQNDNRMAFIGFNLKVQETKNQ